MQKQNEPVAAFPCSGCGLCCTQVERAVVVARKLIAEGNTDEYVRDISEFPFSFTDTGSCEHLGADHRCQVYDHRPLVCSISRVWEKHYEPKGNISRENYYLSALHLCNSLMVEAGVDNKFIEVPRHLQHLSVNDLKKGL